MFFKSLRLTLMQANGSVEFFINLQIMNSMIFEPIFESFNFKNKLPELNKNPNCLETKPTQDVEVLAVQDFQIPCFRPEGPGLYPQSLFAKHGAHDKKTRTSALRTGTRA